MPETRYDPHRGEWTLIAPGRRERPHPAHYANATPEDEDPACPFCPGNESLTPPEVAAIREAGEENAPGWRARCVPNKYPATGSGALERDGEGVFTSLAGGGRHEVLVDSPRHTKGLAVLGEVHAAGVLGLLQERARAFIGTPGVRFAFAFKNHGAMGGASILHSHFQILALPVETDSTGKKREKEFAFYQERKFALLDHIIEAERAQEVRMVEAGDEGAVVFCPWASRFPYLTHIAPWPTEASFTKSAPETIAAVGAALARTLKRYKEFLHDPPVNLSFLLAAKGPDESLLAHRWHIELFPRLTPLAGLETGLGAYINEVAPERAASELREVGFREYVSSTATHAQRGLANEQ
ncbi:MAG: DUF4921 family protein [Nitrospinae bacterium]|nr:DUF4921 family protein [Nitrospinota bacterium]